VNTESAEGEQTAPQQPLLGPHGLVLDPRTRRGFILERELDLTRQGFDFLAYLLRHRGRVVPTDELIREVWGHSVVVDRHFVQTAVYRVRGTLRAAGVEDIIEVTRGVGYGVAAEDPESRPPGSVGRNAIEAALRVSVLPSVIVGAERRILFANDAMARFTGYSVEELEALPSTEVLSPPALRDRRREDLRVVASGVAVVSWGEQLVRRDGTVVYAEMFVEPIEVMGGVTTVLVQFWSRRGESSPLEQLGELGPSSTPSRPSPGSPAREPRKPAGEGDDDEAVAHSH